MTEISSQERYINLSTRKRDGSYVNTPVWFAQEGDTNKYYVYSLRNLGKVKRIKKLPRGESWYLYLPWKTKRWLVLCKSSFS